MKKNKISKNKTRTDKDSMGKVNVPMNALYSAQTQRAINNFPISNYTFTNDFIFPVVIIKRSAAITNHKLKLLDTLRMKAIVKASDDILNNDYQEHFPIDIFQTGSGTSTNMNVNEVIAKLANTFINDKNIDVHPNDHVNMGQSSNDVIPTAINISALVMVENKLIPTLKKLLNSLVKKQKEFKNIIKIGRTHLQDATPITLGQEFSGYVELINKSIIRINNSKKMLS